MTKASYTDLQLELWLRRREQGEIVWITKEGKVLPIKDMTNPHLVNTMRMLERQSDIETTYLEGLAGDWEG